MIALCTSDLGPLQTTARLEGNSVQTTVKLEGNLDCGIGRLGPFFD